MTDDLLPGTDAAVHTHHDAHEDHHHGDGCGHETVTHGDHQDFVHDGHRHAAHGGQWDEHQASDGGDATTGPDGAVATAGLSSH